MFLKSLADDTRLAIVRTLALTDLRAGEVAERVGGPQNTVSYHLKRLRSLGLVCDRRSTWDARDIYYSLDLQRLQALYLAAGASLHPSMGPVDDATTNRTGDEAAQPLRILFLCTHNSARSQLAEAFARKLGGDSVEAYSAGSVVSELHPLTIKLLDEAGIGSAGLYSKTMDRFLRWEFDYIITTCDQANERCPVFPGDPKRIHWSLPDPKAVEDPEAQLRAFERVRVELLTRIRYLLSLPHPRTGERIRLQPADGPSDKP